MVLVNSICGNVVDSGLNYITGRFKSPFSISHSQRTPFIKYYLFSVFLTFQTIFIFSASTYVPCCEQGFWGDNWGFSYARHTSPVGNVWSFNTNDSTHTCFSRSRNHSTVAVSKIILLLEHYSEISYQPSMILTVTMLSYYISDIGDDNIFS